MKTLIAIVLSCLAAQAQKAGGCPTCGGCPRVLDDTISLAALRLDSSAEIANVRAFGARGDGFTDDTAAISEAMTRGSVVFFPRGAYRVTGLQVPANRTLHFNGAALILAPGANSNVFTLDGVSNVRFTGSLTIDGNKRAQTLPQGGGIMILHGSSGNYFQCVEVTDPMDYGVAISLSSENTFDSLTVTQPGGAGIARNYQGTYLYLGGANGNTFRTVYGEGAAGDGLHLAASSQNQFGLVQLRSGGKKGIALLAGSTVNTFDESVLEANGDNGVYLEAGSDSNHLRRVRAKDNTGNGVECNSNHNQIESVVATGSIDAGAGGTGVYVGGSCNVFQSIVAASNQRDGVRVDTGVGNVLTIVSLDNSKREANTSDGLRFMGGATGNIVKALIATDTQPAKTQRYGVTNSASGTANTVAMAYLQGNATGTVLSSGEDVVAQQNTLLATTLPELLGPFGAAQTGACSAEQ